MIGFERYELDTLVFVRDSLLAGLDRMAAAHRVGALATPGPKGSASPAQAGQLTLWLLIGVELEIQRRLTRTGIARVDDV